MFKQNILSQQILFYILASLTNFVDPQITDKLQLYIFYIEVTGPSGYVPVVYYVFPTVKALNPLALFKANLVGFGRTSKSNILWTPLSLLQVKLVVDQIWQDSLGLLYVSRFIVIYIIFLVEENSCQFPLDCLQEN